MATFYASKLTEIKILLHFTIFFYLFVKLFFVDKNYHQNTDYGYCFWHEKKNQLIMYRWMTNIKDMINDSFFTESNGHWNKNMKFDLRIWFEFNSPYYWALKCVDTESALIWKKRLVSQMKSTAIMKRLSFKQKIVRHSYCISFPTESTKPLIFLIFYNIYWQELIKLITVDLLI